jgi:hypothetical protein
VEAAPCRQTDSQESTPEQINVHSPQLPEATAEIINLLTCSIRLAIQQQKGAEQKVPNKITSKAMNAKRVFLIVEGETAESFPA